MLISYQTLGLHHFNKIEELWFDIIKVLQIGPKGRPFNNSTSQEEESFAQFRLAS